MKKLVLLIVLVFGINSISNEATRKDIPFQKAIQYAQFHDAYKIILEHEGYYSNNVDDRGKETYSGITRKYNKEWKGWEYLDVYKITNKIKWNQKIDLLDSLVCNFYFGIWFKEGYDKLYSQKIANYIFDFRVNSPVGIRIVQRSLNDMYTYDYVFDPNSDNPTGVTSVKRKLFYLKITNKLDQPTIDALNSVREDEIFHVMINRRVKFYNNIVKNDKTQEIFLSHWLKRAYTING